MSHPHGRLTAVPELRPFDGGGKLVSGGVVAAIIGATLLGIGAASNAKQAFFSYLTSYAYVTSICLGALLFLAIHHAAKARWWIPVRRVPETIAAVIVLMAVLFIPIILGMKHLYPWVGHGEGLDAHTQHLLHKKAAYLNVGFFLARAALYFLVWSGVAWSLRRWSLGIDRGSPRPMHRERVVSSVLLPAIGITFSFAWFDWLMSLEPTWFSTVFGIYLFGGSMMAAISLTVLIASRTLRPGLFGEILNPFHFHALGRLMLTFVAFWAYIAYVQGFLIYIVNKPEETSWWIPRLAGGWKVVGYLLIFGHFVVPFVLLLSRSLKFKPRQLALVAIWLLIIHYVDIYFLAMPALHKTFAVHWLDLGALLFVGGAAVAFGTWLFRGHPVAPRNDPELLPATAYRSP